MKEKEREILNKINDIYDVELIEKQCQYSRYDAEGQEDIVEIKYREVDYQETIIEFDKYAFNKEYAKINNKAFIYIVGLNDKTYIYHITDLINRGYDFKWRWKKMPWQTEYNKTEWINKYVGFINKTDAIAKIGDRNETV